VRVGMPMTFFIYPWPVLYHYSYCSYKTSHVLPIDCSIVCTKREVWL